jgi:hypothetical protein
MDQMVSSYERSIGQDILGDELACLSYWLLQDSQKKGYFKVNEIAPLLEAFKFDVNPATFNLNAFKKEFKFSL